jgi:phosphatidylglycerophosphatase A
MNRLILILATGLGAGYIPIAPGTWGTALSAVIYWYVLPQNQFIIIPLVLVSFFLAVPICTKAELLFGEHDDSRIVIDEVVGFWISVLMLPKRLDLLISAFVLFRIFDIYKPLIIKKSQDLPGGWGVMVDDAIAGIFTNLIIWGFLAAISFL